MAHVFMTAYTNYRRDPRVRREAEALVARGHRVTFLAKNVPGEPAREVLEEVEVLKTLGLPGKPNSFAAYIFDYVLFLFRIGTHLTCHPRRYALIHVNNMPDFLVFGAWLPRLLGRPVIHDIHDLMPELYLEKFRAGENHPVIRILKLQERGAARFATAVLTVEEGLRDILSARGVPREKIHVLINLPDEKIFRPRGDRPAKAADAPWVMVYHGTLARRLGLDVALRAAARLREDIPNLQFRIIGAGEERKALLRLRSELGLEEVVSFSEGYVPVDRIPEMIADADVGVIPLRLSPGTEIMLPTKLLEYVQVGIPCVTPHTRTIGRYFDETMVRFYEAENAESLAAAVLDVYRRPELRDTMPRIAAEKFLSRYAWSTHQKVYTDLVDRLLGAGGEGQPARQGMHAHEA